MLLVSKKFSAATWVALLASFFSFFCFGNSASAQFQAGEDWDIYLVAGQSNATGFNTNFVNLPPSLQAPQPDVQLFSGTIQQGVIVNASWDDLGPGSGSQNRAETFGPEITLGRTLADANPNRNIGIIKVAIPGADIVNRWNPSNNDLYPNFLANISAATQQITDANATFSIRGLAWHQGEQDGRNLTASGNYDQNLTNFISSIRADLAPNLASDFRVAVGHLGATTFPITDDGNTTVGYAEVQNAQAAVAARDTNVSLVPASRLPLLDDIHFNEAGQQELGIGFAEAFLGQAAEVYLVNASFEFSPQNSEGQFTTRIVSAWQEFDENGVGGDLTATGASIDGLSGDAIGNFNLSADFYTNVVSDSEGGTIGTSDGTTALFFSSDQDLSVVQTLSTLVEAGDTIDLTVAVGDRDAGDRVGFAGYLIELLSDGQVIASVSAGRDGSLGDGTFSDVLLNYTIGENDPIGPLGIRLGTNGAGAGFATDFDNVRLSINSVPVPNSSVVQETPVDPGPETEVVFTVGFDFQSPSPVVTFADPVMPPNPATNFNLFEMQAADGATVSQSDFIDLTGAPVAGLGLDVTNNLGKETGLTGVSSNPTTVSPFNDISISCDNYGAASTPNNSSRADVGELTDESNIVLTFTGLDDEFLYNVTGGGVFNNNNFDTVWTAGGMSARTDSDSTTGGEFVTLSGLETDGSGNLAVTVTRATAHILFAAVTIEATEIVEDNCGLGDVNRDGFVNFLDISPFISLLSMAGEFQFEADTNEDGVVSFLDIAPFIGLLAGGN